MALRPVLVMGSGGIPQVLQNGDYISLPANTPSIRTITNSEASTALVFGTPVYSSGPDQSKRAKADSFTTAVVTGLVYDTSIAIGATGYQASTNVMVAANTALWDAVTGGSGGLLYGTLYFLDPANAGKITATPPTTPGQCVTIIGRAISTLELELRIGEPILL